MSKLDEIIRDKYDGLDEIVFKDFADALIEAVKEAMPEALNQWHTDGLTKYPEIEFRVELKKLYEQIDLAYANIKGEK